MKAKTPNLKWYLYRWNFNVLELLLCIFIFIFLLKQKSLRFVNLSLFLHDISIFWLEPITSGTSSFFAQIWETSLQGARTLLSCKTSIYSWNLFEKILLMYEDWFSIPLLCNLKYINISFIYNSLKSSCKPCFLKTIPDVLGCSINFKIP